MLKQSSLTKQQENADSEKDLSPWESDAAAGYDRGHGSLIKEAEQEQQEDEDYAVTLEAIHSEPILEQPFVQIRKPKKKSRAKDKDKKAPWDQLSSDDMKNAQRIEKALALSKLKKQDEKDGDLVNSTTVNRQDRSADIYKEYNRIRRHD